MDGRGEQDTRAERRGRREVSRGDRSELVENDLVWECRWLYRSRTDLCWGSWQARRRTIPAVIVQLS